MRHEEGGHSRDTLHLVATLAEEEQEADAAQEDSKHTWIVHIYELLLVPFKRYHMHSSAEERRSACDVCCVEVGEHGPWVGVSVTLLWKGTSEVEKVGNHHVGRLCPVDGVEGL